MGTSSDLPDRDLCSLPAVKILCKARFCLWLIGAIEAVTAEGGGYPTPAMGRMNFNDPVVC